MKIHMFPNRFLSILSRGICASLLLTAILAVGALHAEQPGNSLLRKRAPQFARKDLSGMQVDMRAFRGRVVLLNFWATWCAPCQQELPRFAVWQKQYEASGLQIISVAMDDDQEIVRTAARTLDLKFPVIMGDERLGSLYGGILGLPITYLIGRDGKVSARFEGETDLDAMENQIQALLKRR
jgi:cytochrome c biogenesis protein CcmG/thiol:disulfide interchange protein DsbE